MTSGGGRFDFDDGGTYCGGWEDGKAHGHGVCTGPKGQGEYSGAWQYGFEISGVYTWPSGNTFRGQWFQGKRHGLGVEDKGRWVYHGEWTQGFKGRYGVRQSISSGARYEGTWTTGLQDGYGCETYADGGNYHRSVFFASHHCCNHSHFTDPDQDPSGQNHSFKMSNMSKTQLGEIVYVAGTIVKKGNYHRSVFFASHHCCNHSHFTDPDQDPSGQNHSFKMSNMSKTQLGEIVYVAGTIVKKGTYQGQWLRGMRHGYGVRASVPYGLASHYRPKALRASLTSLRSENEDEQVVKNRDKKLDESRGGFVLKAKSDETPPTRRRSIFVGKSGRSSLRKTIISGLKLKKQKSTGDINDSPKRQSGSVRSTISNISQVSADSTQSGMTNVSVYTDSNLSFVSQDDITDINVTETYMGEWKNDKRSGFGISERSDGLKYEGEWYNNKKYGYGVTTFKDGTKEEGKYKNNILISSGKKNKLFLIRTSKLRERVDNAVLSAQRSAQIALQKADVAITRMANARAKAEQADQIALKAEQDSDVARLRAKEFAPEFHQPGPDIRKKLAQNVDAHEDYNFSPMKNLQQNHNPHNPRSTSMMDHTDGNPGAMLSDGISPVVELGLGTGPSHQGNTELNYLNVSGYGQNPHSMNSPTHGPVANHSPHNRSPSLKIRRYSFLAGSRRGRGFSEIFNSTILNDHFDQYSAPRDDSGLGRELIPGEEQYKGTNDTSPDSGVSGVSETTDETSNHRPLQRRRTLPCITKEESEEKQQLPEKETANSSENLASKRLETYIIENGIRRRVQGIEKKEKPHISKADLPKAYKIESQNKLGRSGKHGSLPDITVIKTEKNTPIPRDEAYRLGTARREEIRRLQDLAERRKQGDVTVILGDLKDFVQQRQMLVLVIAVNVSLATMFFNLLS